MEWHRVADKSMRGDEIGELNLPVKRIDIIPVLIELVLTNRGDDVANFQSRFCRRHFRLHARHINAGRFACLSRIFAQVRIARWEKTESDGRKTAVVLRVGVLEKMRDDRRRNRVDGLSTTN